MNDQLIDYLTRFQSNTQTPAQVKTNELDAKFKPLFNYYVDPVAVDTMYVSSSDELLREFVYKTYLQKNNYQETYFRTILSQR